MKIKNILYVAHNTIGGIGTVITTLLNTFNKGTYRSRCITSRDNPVSMFLFFLKVLIRRPVIINKKKESSSYDIYHFQGAWTLHLFILRLVKNTKTIVSPHGAFNKVSLQKSYFKKRLVSFLYMKSAYKNSDCITASTEIELNNIKDYGINNVPIALIPIGIDLDEEILSDHDLKRELLSWAKNRKIILSLSRLDVSKGIDLLLEAYNNFLHKDQYVLFIVGDGDSKYEKKLSTYIENNGLNSSVKMFGFREGIAKHTFYDVADLFVLPSYNEGFGITILEALRQNTPVIASKGTPFRELPKRNCGWYVETNSLGIEKAMREFHNLNDLELIEMKKNGLGWLKEDFDQKIINTKMDSLYSWIISKGERPSFVY